ncbi:acyltransferase family protein [Candidatus Latescibacterota bacterium]
MSTSEKKRMLYVDNIRILLITLIMLLHVAITYGAPGDWYYHETLFEDLDLIPGIVYALFNMTVQAFALGFFFMISGYFTPGSYDRKGTGPFLRDRMLRLGIPLMFYILTIHPIIDFTRDVVVRGRDISVAGLGVYTDKWAEFGTGPMWFVAALLIFNIFYVMWRRLTKSTDPSVSHSGSVPGNGKMIVFALAVGIMSFIVRIWLPVGWSFETLGFQFPHFSQYISMFIIGLVAYRGNWFEGLTDAKGIRWGMVTVLLIVLCPIVLLLGGAAEDSTIIMGGISWQALFYAVWEQFICIGMIAGLSVLFRKVLNHQGSVLRAMSKSAYTVYIIHAPVIVFLGLALRNIELYPPVKFLLVAPVAVSLGFFLSNVIRKLPLARKIL